MMGITATIRAIAMLAMVIILAAGGWYVMNIKADLAVSEANNEKLAEATRSQNDLIESMKKDIQQIQQINGELQQAYERQKKDVDTLNSKFSKRDFGALAAEKPAVVEKLVNRGTKNAMRCFELATGAQLNDQEKSAKTASEANRECPAFIDHNYTAPN